MKLGLGTVQLGMDYGVANKTGKPKAGQAMELLRIAAAGGIDCFDTAGSYGDSEELLGRFMKESGRKSICSKFSSCRTAEAELNSSLERLGVDRLDYFLLHKPELMHDDAFDDTLYALNRTSAAGKLGVSVYTAREAEECLRHDIQVIQLPFNIVDTRLLKSGVIKRIKARGIELHARSVYLQGLLLTEGLEVTKSLDRMAAELGLDRKSLCFAYVRDSVVDRFFIGCETAAQVRENLELYKLPVLPLWVAERVFDEFSNVEEGLLNPALWKL